MRYSLKALVAVALLFLSFFPVQARKVQAYFAYSLFSAPGTGPYLETYLSVIGRSVVFKKNEHNKYINKYDMMHYHEKYCVNYTNTKLPRPLLVLN